MTVWILLALLVGVAIGGWSTWGWMRLSALLRYRKIVKLYAEQAEGNPVWVPPTADEVERERQRWLTPAVPQYGRPAPVLYRESAYEEPMRCSGEGCDHHELADGEAVQRIPILNGPEGAEILVCLDCAVQPS